MAANLVFSVATLSCALSIAFGASIGNNGAENLRFESDSHVAVNNVVKFFDYPFSVSLWFKSNKEVVKYCGAVRLSKTWFVTGASCLENITSYDEVQLMHASTKEIHKSYGGESLTRLKYVIHPEYNKTSKANDIALFQRKINLHDGRLPGLPGSKKDVTKKYAGIPVSAYRWLNATTQTDFEDRFELNAVQGTVVENSRCKLYYPLINNKQLCISLTNGETFTENDTGVPVVIYDGKDRHILVGIVSSLKPLKKGGTISSPVLITQMFPYLEWMYYKSGKEIPSWT